MARSREDRALRKGCEINLDGSSRERSWKERKRLIERERERERECENV